VPTADVAVIALGEAPRADVEAAIAQQFGGLSPTWLDRRELRRRPLRTLARLVRQQFHAAVLVAPDLRQPRLRLTSLVLGLPRADRRWRIDLHGNREAWSPSAHLAQHVGPMARHLLACLLAFALAVPVLRLLNALIKPRQMPTRQPTRLLYLRSQLWLGLAGGGSVAHTAGVIGGLEQAGVRVDVVSSDRLAGVAAPIRVVPPEMWFDGWLRELEDLAYNVAFFTAAFGTARRVRPDAVYQRHTAFNCVGAVLSRVLDVPLVLEFNSSELWKGRYWGGLRQAGAAALVERINLRAADRIIVVSRVLADELKSHGVPASKIVVNPNAVDASVFRPDHDGDRVRRRHRLDSSVVVGFSGTFGAWHGIPTLARSLPLVLQARPSVRWLLIGDGPLRSVIAEPIERGGFQDKVKLTGMLSHSEMPAYLAACDILVSPHGRQVDGGEFFGSPTKLFEYMAMGRPIVASGVGQIAEVLRDESTALLVPADDAEALVGAIVRLVDDAWLRARLGTAARQAAAQQHTWRQNAERVLECLARD
jgi:glycosyltransferase involved in cell wall biosynthesis